MLSASTSDRRDNPYMPRSHVVDNDALAARPHHHRLTIKESPHVLLSCATGFPHKIKFRKRVTCRSLCDRHGCESSVLYISMLVRIRMVVSAIERYASMCCSLLQVRVWPFCFDARMDYSRIDRAFQYGGSCRVWSFLNVLLHCISVMSFTLDALYFKAAHSPEMKQDVLFPEISSFAIQNCCLPHTFSLTSGTSKSHETCSIAANMM